MATRAPDAGSRFERRIETVILCEANLFVSHFSNFLRIKISPSVNTIGQGGAGGWNGRPRRYFCVANGPNAIHKKNAAQMGGGQASAQKFPANALYAGHALPVSAFAGGDF